MDLTNILDKLELKHPYQILIYVGVAIFFISLFIDIRSTLFTSGQLQVGAVGLFCLGLGQWICWDREVKIVPPNVYLGGRALEVSRDIWRPTPIGIILDLAGLALLIITLLSVVGIVRTF